MAPMRLMRAARPGDGRARVGPDRQRLLDAPASGPRRRCPSTRWRRRPSSRSHASTPTATRPTECSSTRSARARRSRSCGWRRAACSTSRCLHVGADDREEALRTAGSKRPIGRLAEVEEIAAAIVFLCSRAGLLRRRRRLVGRRRHRAGDHLSGRLEALRGALLTPAEAGLLDAHGQTEAAVLVPVFSAIRDDPGLDLHRAPPRPPPPRRRDLVSRAGAATRPTRRCSAPPCARPRRRSASRAAEVERRRRAAADRHLRDQLQGPSRSSA